MAGKCLVMAKIKEIQRLVTIGLSDRAIARALKIDRRSVQKYREGPSSKENEPHPTDQPEWCRHLEWDRISAEARRGVPLMVLWEELKERNRINVQYPAFWKQVRKRGRKNCQIF